MRFGILGTGNMAEAILSGLIRKKILKASSFTGFDTRPKRLKFIKKKYHIQTAVSALEVVEKSDVILLSVKPQHLGELLQTIKSGVKPSQLFLSIAAGLSTQWIENFLGSQISLVRLMPNTPALLGLGATAYFLNRNCTSKARLQTERFFSAIGIACEVKKEEILDAVTGLSGSGPAYVYAFIKALIQGGIKMGLSPEIAKNLSAQTIIGSTYLFLESKEEPETLITKVASNGGTTEAGLKILEQNNFTAILEACIEAATNRAKELREA